MVENAELAKGKRRGKKKKRNLCSNYGLADTEVNSEQVNLSLVSPVHTHKRGQCQQTLLEFKEKQTRATIQK